MQSDLHRSWLCSAGIKVPRDTLVEISPLFALDAVDVKRRVSDIPDIAGRNIYIE